MRRSRAPGGCEGPNVRKTSNLRPPPKTSLRLHKNILQRPVLPDDLRKTDWIPSTIIEREVAARNQERVRHEWMALTLGTIVGVAIPILIAYLAMQISPLGVFAFFPGIALSLF